MKCLYYLVVEIEQAEINYAEKMERLEGYFDWKRDIEEIEMIEMIDYTIQTLNQIENIHMTNYLFVRHSAY